MNVERDKYLTEAMGECWHESVEHLPPTFNDRVDRYICKCGVTTPYSPNFAQINLSAPDGFFKLWNWSHEQEWWYELADSLHYFNGHNIRKFNETIIHPDKFADAIFSYLKENNK